MSIKPQHFLFNLLVLHLRLYLISFIYAGLLKTIKLFFIVSKYNINFFSFTNYTFFISHYSMIFEICQLNFNIFCSFESLVLYIPYMVHICLATHDDRPGIAGRNFVRRTAVNGHFKWPSASSDNSIKLGVL